MKKVFLFLSIVMLVSSTRLPSYADGTGGTKLIEIIRCEGAGKGEGYGNRCITGSSTCCPNGCPTCDPVQ